MQNSEKLIRYVLKYKLPYYVTFRHLAAFSKHAVTSQCFLSNTFSGIEKSISQPYLIFGSQIRLKSYKSIKSMQSKSSEYKSDSDSDSDDDIPQELQHGAKVTQIQTDSLRCDLILKYGLGFSRNKLEMYFYEGRIRVNGSKIMKKSANVELRDEIDVIKHFDEENPNLIHVGRVEVLKARPSGDFILLTIRKFKNILIENYEKDPWEEKQPEKENNENEMEDEKKK